MPATVDPTELTIHIDNPSIPAQQYGLGIIALFCKLVVDASVSLTGTSHVLQTLFAEQESAEQIPHPTTGRMWLLRLGLFKLERRKTYADDWVWLLDHVVLPGNLKCLIIAGVRLSELPPPSECLQLSDLEPIAILPVDQCNGDIVAAQLKQCAAQNGVPCALLSDEGNDLVGGEKQFAEEHSATIVLSDITHFAARMLKRRLEKNERWQEFCRQSSQTKSATGQTELAALSPPNQRSKARFMNLGPLLGWADRTLTILDQPPAVLIESIAPERLEEKFGWLREFRTELDQWSQWQRLAEAAIDVVRRHGYGSATPALLHERLAPLSLGDADEKLRAELTDFVVGQSSHAKAGQQLPGSTEILESSFGKLKSLLGDQQKGGFTHLLLSYAALLGEITNDLISNALQRIPVKKVLHWCRNSLPTTLQSQRATIRHAMKNAQEYPEEPHPTT